MGSTVYFPVLLRVMVRPLRLEAEGAVYHVIARGNGRKAVFRDDRDLMGNHLHLAVERGPVKLSRVMLALQSAYTHWFNKHGRVGHLFQGRYKAFLVERDRYLLALICCIHRNPVAAGLGARRQDFAWSSDRYYRRGRAPEWLDLDHVLPLLGPTRPVAASRYRKLMGERVSETYENLRSHAQTIKGDESFAKRMLRVAGVQPVARVGLTEANVAAVMADALGLRLQNMTAGGHRAASQARIVAAHLGRSMGGIPVSRMAKYFGREESTLVRGVLTLEKKLKVNTALRRRVDHLITALQRNGGPNT